MTGRGAVVTTAAGAVMALLMVHPVAARADGWRELLERSLTDPTPAFSGRLVVVGFGSDGPSVSEVEVVQTADGELQVGRPASWFIGREDGEAMYGDLQARELLRLGEVQEVALSADLIASNYDCAVTSSEAGVAGATDVLLMRPKGSEHLRDRLYLDAETGLVVRRETFDDLGRPVRLVAFTELTIGARAATPALQLTAAPSELPGLTMEEDAQVLLRELGWQLPGDLPGGFTLHSAHGFGDSAPSLQAVYSDGLFTLSVFQQAGMLDEDALQPGAVAATVGDGHVYRWPGAQPERLVWPAGGTTYTVVSDAPPDLLFDAVAALPHDPPPGFVTRIGRGIRRVGSWLWPFS